MFQRITVDAKQMGGAPCIRGLRIPVSTVVGMVADGLSEDGLLHHIERQNQVPVRIPAFEVNGRECILAAST